MPSDVSTLVDHFFRHEYGRLVALLTKSFGVRQLDLIEEAVQSALSKGLQVWARAGIPRDPAAWLYRTAKNTAIDALRRSEIELRTLAKISAETTETQDDDRLADAVLDSDPGDETLRLLYLCCHPTLALESRVALALKIVGGFSVDEIANAFLISKSNAEKRLTRAKDTLRDRGTEISELTSDSAAERVEAVLSTIYLIFTEGYAATVGDNPVRSDLCEEAMRLARMCNQHSWSRSPATAALLGLLLLQSSRMDARVDADGAIVLLGEQDRTCWDTGRIREAMHWLTLAAEGNVLSRYHVEAAIAWEHARAENLESVDWPRVISLYEKLTVMNPGPMVRLNLVIAQSRVCGADSALKALVSFSDDDRRRLRPWWDCAIAEIFEKLNRPKDAVAHLTDALALSTNAAQRKLIERKRDRLTGRGV
ncbi:MAG: sigma-70 family RNA polymerase sigma factor [Planctomycetaceae bacterium]|nr:sigma-70 family RNA polymerase sigma factor [Planctomycetaceae bacterium]